MLATAVSRPAGLDDQAPGASFAVHRIVAALAEAVPAAHACSPGW